MSSSSLSLIIAVDHPLMGAGIKEVLSTERIYNLTAIAETGAKCIELMQRLQPHMAIIDLNISHPGAAGILREAKLNHWQTRICFLIEDQIPLSVHVAGEDGMAVFAKARFPGELRDRLREIANALLAENARAVNRLPDSMAGARFSQRLTLRQNQIVAMLQVGSSNRQIAQVLGLSEGTIKVHLHRIYQRIGVSNRTQLATKSLAAE